MKFDYVPNSELSAAIDEYVKGSNNRKIMKDRYIDYLTFQQLADRYNYTVRQIQYIVHKGETQLFKHLKI